MWFGTRTGLPEGALWSTQDGASFIQYSKMKEILHQQFFFLVVYVCCCCFKSSSSEGFVSENHILNVNFVKETQVINSKVQLTIESRFGSK